MKSKKTIVAQPTYTHRVEILQSKCPWNGSVEHMACRLGSTVTRLKLRIKEFTPMLVTTGNLSYLFEKKCLGLVVDSLSDYNFVHVLLGVICVN